MKLCPRRGYSASRQTDDITKLRDKNRHRGADGAFVYRGFGVPSVDLLGAPARPRAGVIITFWPHRGDIRGLRSGCELKHIKPVFWACAGAQGAVTVT